MAAEKKPDKKSPQDSPKRKSDFFSPPPSSFDSFSFIDFPLTHSDPRVQVCSEFDYGESNKNISRCCQNSTRLSTRFSTRLDSNFDEQIKCRRNRNLRPLVKTSQNDNSPSYRSDASKKVYGKNCGGVNYVVT